MTLLSILAAVVLLLLNAFFVMAEFAIVKLRATRVEELAEEGDSRAKLVAHIHGRLEEYLSVCQLGITFASIALGFIGEPAIAGLIEPYLGSWLWAHAVSVSIAYLIISFLHILFGEQIPKLIGIKRAESAALRSAVPLYAFRVFFSWPLWALNGSANFVLKLLGLESAELESRHSQEELRIIMERSQASGLLSFRRLLLMENVFDLGEVKVKGAMRSVAETRVLNAAAPWSENFEIIRNHRLSRYPLMDGASKMPIGIIHVKDLLYGDWEDSDEVNLREQVRPFTTVREDQPVETLLAHFQRTRGHLVIVLDKNDRWTGIISLEDVIEEIIGTIEDEFEKEPSVYVADIISPERVVFGLEARSIKDGIREALTRVPASKLPVPAETVFGAVGDREDRFPAYLGRGIVLAQARLPELKQPVLVFARSKSGIKVDGTDERASLFFILLTDSSASRVRARLLTRIGNLVDSEYIRDRLAEAKSPAAVIEALQASPTAIS